MSYSDDTLSDKYCEKEKGTSMAKKSSTPPRRPSVSTHSPSFPDLSILTRYLIWTQTTTANMETEEALGSLSRRGHWRLHESRDQPFLSLSFLSFISLSRLARCSAFRSHDCTRQRANSTDGSSTLANTSHKAQIPKCSMAMTSLVPQEHSTKLLLNRLTFGKFVERDRESVLI